MATSLARKPIIPRTPKAVRGLTCIQANIKYTNDMIALRRITPTDTCDWERFIALYIESFPEKERRPIDSLEHLASACDMFKAEVIETEHGFAGFLTHWDLGEFIYGEHFAVSAQIRGGGIGGRVIDMFTSRFDKTIVLEAETATDDMSRRRLGFYARHGFIAAPYPYAQPAYSPQQKPVPMHLLSYGRQLSEEEFNAIRGKIYKTVYNIAEQ